MKWIVTLLGACITIVAIFSTICLGQRIPPPPQNFLNNLNNQQPPPQQQNISSGLNIQLQQQQNDELANIKDESIKRVLLELSTLQTPSQMSETMARVAQLVGPLFISHFDERKDQIVAQGRDASSFPQRLLAAVTDIQGEEVKALVLQKKLEVLHAADFAFLPLAIQYGLQDEILRNLSGTKLASVVKANPGDTVIAFKVSTALADRSDQQLEFLQSLGTKLLPEVQRIIMRQLLQWWGDPHNWKDRELSLLTSAGNPLLAFMPQSDLESLDDELADRFVTILGQTQDIGRGWWRKPMSLKKAWFELAKGARYFGAVHEWSFRRMQKLSFLLEGASPEDLELIPPVPEIKGLVIGNHYTELQARIVFDAFYHTAPLSQEDLQEFQFHVLDLIPTQLQRFDFADSFGTLDEMLSILERQSQPSYPTILQISYSMWPIVNSTSAAMSIAPPAIWQKRELSQIGKLFFLLPKSTLMQIKPDIINWDSNILSTIRSNHLSTFQIWRLSSQILQTVDDRFRPDYIFMIPSPFQKGIPTQNISQALLGTTTVRPEILRALIEETSGMLTSQKAVILQRIINRVGEPIIIRTMISTEKPVEMFNLISPKVLSKNMATIIKTVMEMPETGRFGITSVQTKLLPHITLSLWLKWVRENAQVSRWTAEDLLGRSPMGATHELDLAILGLSCRDIEIVDPWDVLSVIMHYRHELYNLRRFNPSLKFNVNLRSCVLQKFVEYLKQKRFINGDQEDGHVLSEITMGEIEAVGGEILSMVPTKALDQLQIKTRQDIIKEIGKLQMLELFSLVALPDLHWYGTTLFRDIEISSTTPDALRQRRQVDNTGATSSDGTNTTTPAPGLDSQSVGNSPSTQNTLAPPPTNSDMPATPASPPKGINVESLNNMGNLICYADNFFDTDWPRNLLKDVLEAKTSIGEKTCCLSKVLREKWFEALKTAYGSDTSSWNEFDLSAIGDFLIALPEQDLQKISLDSLGKAVTPMMRQSAFDIKIAIPGQVKKIQFATACIDALGTEGLEFNSAYKKLMKRLFQASQWNVNTVKTTQELIRDGVGRTGRIPRWAEHTLVKRQIAISTGGDLSYTGFTPAPVNSQGGDAYSNQNMRQSMYAAPSSSFTNPGMTNTQPLSSYSPQQSTMSYGNQGASSLSPQSISNFPAQSGYSQPAQQQNINPTQSSTTQYSSQYTVPTVNNYSPQQQQLPTTASQYSPQYSPAYSSPQGIGSSQNQPSQGIGSNQYQQSQGIGNNPQPSASYSPQMNAGYGSPTSSLTSPQSQTSSGYMQSSPGYSSPSNTNSAQLLTPSFVPQSLNTYPQPGSTQSASNLPLQQQQGGTANVQQFSPSYYSPSVGNQGAYPSYQYPNQPLQPGTSGVVNPSQPISSFGGSGTTGVTGTGAFTTSATGTVGAGAFGTAGAGATGASASTAAIAGGGLAQGNANANTGGGSFAQANTFAGNNAGNANAFGGNTGIGQGGDLSQGGSFSQAGANTFATRGLGNQQQSVGNSNFNQQQGATFNMNQQQPGMQFNQQQQGANNMGFQQTGMNSQQQQGLGGQQIPGSLSSQQAGGINQQQANPSGSGSLQQGSSIAGVSATANSAVAGRAGGGDTTSSTVTGTSSTGTTQEGRTRSLEFGAAQDETHNSEITCHGIKAAGPAAIGLGIDDLNKLTQTDLFDCVEALGKIEWDDETKGQILSLLKQKLEFNKDSINALTLIEMGDLVTAFNTKAQDSSISDGFTSSTNTTSGNITVHSDVSMIDFTLPSSLDILSILGQQIVNPDLLKALAEKFNQDNRIFPGFSEGIARPENLRIVVMSLGNVICGLSDKIVNSIFETDASLFIDTSRILGRLEGCSNEVLSTLAAHAVRPSNYGPPRLWSQEDVETVGVVFAGLKPDAITTIPSDAMQGLTPLAIKNLPVTGLLSFTTDQLSKMSFRAAMALSPSQLNNLTPAELEAVKVVLEVQPELFNVPVVPDDHANQDLVARGIALDDGNQTDIHGRARPDTVLTTPAPEVEGTDVEADNMDTTEATTTTPRPTGVTEPVPKSSSSNLKLSFLMILPLIVSVIPVILI
ncbi:unnamed protein product [Orchesella dallaii]|uniref:Uncharacterized protein n=1 Tax=Orchesella dallaii TaxID=48710 RepID=A0ABP1R7W9_9HEXA